MFLPSLRSGKAAADARRLVAQSARVRLKVADRGGLMAVHILNCAPMSPWFPRWHIGGTCLLVETDRGLVLVDTGLGLHDYSNPTWMVRFFRLDFGVHADPENTAVRQLARLRSPPEALQHIVMTS